MIDVVLTEPLAMGLDEKPEGTDEIIEAIYFCGSTRVQAQFEGAHLTIVQDKKAYSLRRVPAGSGAKFQSPGPNQSVMFWDKGQTAWFSKEGKTYPECQRVHEKVSIERLPFRASGNEPAWTLLIEEDRIELFQNYGREKEILPLSQSATMRGGHRYTAATKGHSVNIEVRDQLCHDSMTGMPYPKTVMVSVDQESLFGCGGLPDELVQGAKWIVETIGGEPTEREPQVTIRFKENGRLSGRAPCNSYRAAYELSGEGMSVGMVATTKMACPDPLMSQEKAFFDILGQVVRVDLTREGTLLLVSSNGATIRARR